MKELLNVGEKEMVAETVASSLNEKVCPVFVGFVTVLDVV